MSGPKKETYKENETRSLADREDRLREFILQQRPIAATAKLEGLEVKYASRLVNELARREGLQYQPRKITSHGKEEILGVTEASKRFRGKLGDHLYLLGEDRRAVANQTGIGHRAQIYAKQRPFNYDWTLSNIERLAIARGIPFKNLMLEALLTPQERERAERMGLFIQAAD